MHKRDVLEFSSRLEDNLSELHQELADGTYRHDPYERFYVDDPKRRHISKASVRDRVVHQAVVNAIEPRIERSLIFDTYASRREKGTHAAIDRLDAFLRQASSNGTRRVFALKCDVRKYFDSIRHDILLATLRRYVADERLLRLLELIIRSHASDETATRGLPLGNVTSQLFANLYLSGFDHWIKERLKTRRYLRFCDDFVLLDPDRAVLESATVAIRTYLANRLDLQLHPNKVSIRTYVQGVDFVGWVLRPHARTLRGKTYRRLLRRVQTGVDAYGADGDFNDSFGASVQSGLGLLSHGDQHVATRELRDAAWRITRVHSTSRLP